MKAFSYHRTANKFASVFFRTVVPAALVLCLTISLAGCGGKADPGSATHPYASDVMLVTPCADAPTDAPATEPVTPSPEPEPYIELKIDPETLYSRSYILKDITNQTVLLAENEDQKIFPASMTKIMTAILFIENVPLDEKLTVTTETIKYALDLHASLAGIYEDETVSAETILAGILLASGAECSLTAAIRIAGSEENFAELMNARAAELGMTGSHFVTCTGLHNDLHYTTVSDLMKLTEYALRNETFMRFFTLSEYTIPTDNKRYEPYTITGTASRKALNAFDFGDITILGGKTGYTSQAGLCLDSLATDGHHYFVLITAANDGNLYTEKFHFMDAATVYKALSDALAGGDRA